MHRIVIVPSNHTHSKLAIGGGRPAVTDKIPAWPPLDPEISEAIARLFAENTWGNYFGSALDQLEIALAELFQVDFVWNCSSGTIGVELALRGCNIDSGEIILAGYDFPGNFRAVESVGARPVLVDVIQGGWVIDAAQLQNAISAETKAIIVSHLHGQFADMATIMRFAQDHGLRVIEDACQCPGAKTGGQAVGSFADVGVISFGGSKLLSAGRGGAVLTADQRIWQRIKIFCERGNNAFPLSQLQAAVLLPQLKKLLVRNEIRAKNVKSLVEQARSIRQIQIGCLDNPDAANDSGDINAFYKIPWRVKNSESRDWLIAALVAEGVDVGAGFKGFMRRTASRCRHVGDLNHSQTAATSTVLLHHACLLGDNELITQIANAFAKLDG